MLQPTVGCTGIWLEKKSGALLKPTFDVCMKREAKRGKTFDAPKIIYERGLIGRSRTCAGCWNSLRRIFAPDLIVDSDKLNPNQCAQKIMEEITKKFS